MTKDMLNQKELDSIEKIDLANTTWWQPKIDRSDLKKLMKRKDLPAWIHAIIYFGSLQILTFHYLCTFILDHYLVVVILLFCPGVHGMQFLPFFFMELYMPTVILGGMNMDIEQFLKPGGYMIFFMK